MNARDAIKNIINTVENRGFRQEYTDSLRPHFR